MGIWSKWIIREFKRYFGVVSEIEDYFFRFVLDCTEECGWNWNCYCWEVLWDLNDVPNYVLESDWNLINLEGAISGGACNQIGYQNGLDALDCLIQKYLRFDGEIWTYHGESCSNARFQ